MMGLGIAFVVLMSILAAASSSKASSATPAPGTPGAIDVQKKVAQALAALTVGPDGKIVGPVTKEGIQVATSIAGELDAAGYKDAAAQIRKYVTAAQTLLAPIPPGQQIPLPPSIPPDLQNQINIAIHTERDPKVLQAIIDALKKLPPSPEVTNAINMLQALLLQVQTEQAQAQVLSQVQTVLSQPMSAPPYSPPPTTSPGWTTAPPQVSPATGNVIQPGAILATPSGSTKVRPTLSLAAKSYGPDVGDWQGYIGVTRDQQFGPNTDAKTKVWQKSKGLAADGIVGPKSWAMAEGTTAMPTNVIPIQLPNINIPGLPTMPVSFPTVATPGVVPGPNTPTQAAAQAVVNNLKAVQGSYGMPGSKGREDKSLVSRLQVLGAGDTKPDGMAGPGTLLLAATSGGQSDLPLVMYWPKSTNQSAVLDYRSKLLALASAAQASGNTLAAAQLQASAARERGQAGIVGPMPA